MLRACAIALSLTAAAMVGVQAVPAQTERARPAKSLHATTAAQPSKRAPLPGANQGEKNWMDRASAPSNGGGGGGGGM
jgi:hypothetical protein